MMTTATKQTPAVQLQGLGKRFDNQPQWAVDRIDLAVEPGTLLVILGESGSGKTTTLKMINRLIEPTEGRVLINGKDVRDRDPVGLRRGIGYAFQGVGLFPHMTLAQNIGITPSLLGWPAQKTTERVGELLSLVGLEPGRYRERLPSQLSGGQRQRVGFARALAAGPELLLMDEPFGALDPLTRESLQRDFCAVHRRLGLTTIMVSHDISEALALGDRIAVMCAGRVHQHGTPAQLLSEPETGYVEQLMSMPRTHARRLAELTGGAGGG